MEYLKLIVKKAFGKIWVVGGIISTFVATVADAIWGDNAPVQYIAWAIIAVVAIILIFRLLFLAPYQLWAEERAKLEAVEKSEVDPLKAKRKVLLEASSRLLTSAKAIFHKWSVSDDHERKFLTREYHKRHSRMTSLADNFLHEEDIYRAAQDAMNRCNIVITDAAEGLQNYNDLKDAHEFTEILLTLLTSDNKKKP